MRKLARFASLAAAAWAGALGAAAQGHPTAVALPCGQGVQVSSGGAPLREVLQEMATSLKFQLQYLSNENPPIRLEGRHRTLELVQLLSTQANLAVRYRRDPACKGQWKIATIWVLSPGASADAARRVGAPALAPVAVPSAAATPDTTPDGQEEYLRLHGLPPQRQN